VIIFSGGAMASLAAATIVSTKITIGTYVWLVTYGQPRTGDKNYAASFLPNGTLHIKNYRIVHNRDIVSHLPPLDLSVYYHHVDELWYPNDMLFVNGIIPYIECSYKDGEDPTCSDSLTFTLNPDDHKYYYGREVRDYGIKGCPDLGTPIENKLENKAVKAAAKYPKPYSFRTKQNKKL
jgi:hypothetical protein